MLALLVDAGGTLRAKRLGAAAATRAFEDGWGFIDAIEWWAPDDTVRREGGARSHPAHLELESGRPSAFGSNAAVFFAEFDDPLRELSARFQLARLVERAADSGVVARVGWEFECIVLEETDPHPVPAMRDNRCWSALTMATEEEDLAALVGTLEAGGVRVDHVCAELGPGCLEIALAPDEPRSAADHAALAKLYTRAFYARQDRQATFMAQLGPGFPGLGGHPSLSLHSSLDGRPLLAEETGVLSKTGAAAVAGIVALLPELMALVAPYPNSYRRFGAGNWAPSTANVGSGQLQLRAAGRARRSPKRPAGASDPRRRRQSAPLPRHVARCRLLRDRAPPRTAAARCCADRWAARRHRGDTPSRSRLSGRSP